MIAKRHEIRDLDCWRCGAPADTEWFDVATVADPDQNIAGRMWCRTDGCLNEAGSSATRYPPSPDELAAMGAASLAVIKANA